MVSQTFLLEALCLRASVKKLGLWEVALSQDHGLEQTANTRSSIAQELGGNVGQAKLKPQIIQLIRGMGADDEEIREY